MEPTLLSETGVLNNLKIRMFGKSFLMHPGEDLAIHPSTIGDNLQEQASRFAFYASVRDMASAKVDGITLELKQMEAKLDQTIRGEGELPGGGKITETGLIAAINNDGDYQATQEELAEAKHHLDLLQTVVRAFEQRRDCLLALSSRANNTTFNDKDLDVTVMAKIRKLIPDETKSMGAHPSKKSNED